MRNVLLRWLFTSGRPVHKFPAVSRCTTWSRASPKFKLLFALGRHWVLFALGRHWVLTNGTWHVLLQSGSIFELGGITICFAALWKIENKGNLFFCSMACSLIHFDLVIPYFVPIHAVYMSYIPQQSYIVMSKCFSSSFQFLVLRLRLRRQPSLFASEPFLGNIFNEQH